MAEFDNFANRLLEEAKRFLEKAQEESDDVAEAANLHAALLLSFCAFEAHINSIGEEFSIVRSLSPHEIGLLLGKPVRLDDGQFQLQKGLKMARLEERFEFLHTKFSGKPVDKQSRWWTQLASAIELRNKLTHAKIALPVSPRNVRDATESIIEALDALYQAIYKRKFPSASQGLHSTLTF